MQGTDIQEEEIRMIINLPYVEGTSKKLKCIPRSHKIKSMFYTKSTLRKLLCKSKDQVATKDKKSIICQIEWSNCEEVSFDEYKRSLKIAFRWTYKTGQELPLWKVWNFDACLGTDQNFS